jgi:hypothetical protein
MLVLLLGLLGLRGFGGSAGTPLLWPAFLVGKSFTSGNPRVGHGVISLPQQRVAKIVIFVN